MTALVATRWMKVKTVSEKVAENNNNYVLSRGRGERYLTLNITRNGTNNETSLFRERHRAFIFGILLFKHVIGLINHNNLLGSFQYMGTYSHIVHRQTTITNAITNGTDSTNENMSSDHLVAVLVDFFLRDNQLEVHFTTTTNLLKNFKSLLGNLTSGTQANSLEVLSSRPKHTWGSAIRGLTRESIPIQKQAVLPVPFFDWAIMFLGGLGK